METRSGGRSTMVNRSNLRRTVEEGAERTGQNEAPEWMAQTLRVRNDRCKPAGPR